MIIAAPSAVAPRTPVAPSAAAPTTPTTPFSPAGVPASALASARGHQLLALPGASTLSWGIDRPNVLTLYVADERSAAVAKALLEPTIDGVTLEVGLRDSRTPYTGPELTDPTELGRAIAALPGVWDRTFRKGSPLHLLCFANVINERVVAGLDPILRDEWVIGTSPKGMPIRMLLKWRVGVPA